jgi:hypothetical protein
VEESSVVDSWKTTFIEAAEAAAEVNTVHIYIERQQK